MEKQKDLGEISSVQIISQEQEPNEVEKEFSIAELEESISKMTRKVKFVLEKNSYMYYIVNLSEKKKYGSKSTEKVDEKMRICSNASLTIEDNKVFSPSQTFEGRGKLTKKEIALGLEEKLIEKTINSGISKGNIKIDEEGNYVRNKDLVYYDERGKKLKSIPSSLFLKNSPNEIGLKNLISVDDALDHDIKARYVLFPFDESPVDLQKALQQLETGNESQYFSFKFNYYESYNPMDAFLQLISEDERNYILMNVGRKIKPLFIGRDTQLDDIIEIDEEFEFDLSI